MVGISELVITGVQIRVRTGKLFFLFLNQNICCGYSKEPSQRDGSFEHPKHMFKLTGKEINTNLGTQTILIWTYVITFFCRRMGNWDKKVYIPIKKT